MKLITAPSELLIQNINGIVTGSKIMLKFLEKVSRASLCDIPLLLRGETGTGKELLSQYIYRISDRRKGPFQAVNCATFTPELLASELFGHKKGSFTGAYKDHEGLFSRAHNGVLFLDEVAELPLEIQARLLRVLQDNTFIPVGGTTAIKVDVRIISATHRSLRNEVENKRFREDLMYRLRVVPLFIPALREREGDLEALIWYFIREYNLRSKRRLIDNIAEDAFDAMLSYPWPGNIRELQNNMAHAYALGDGPTLLLHDLAPELYESDMKSSIPNEREIILQALKECQGKKNLTAKKLGISRSTLWRKIREYKI